MCYRKRMTYQLIQYEARDGIAQITLNRPEKLNAWTPQMAVEQADAIGRANDDRSVGAIVMTGAGRALFAGADMELTLKARIEGRGGGGVRARRPPGRAREAPRHGVRAGARNRRQPGPTAPHDEGAAHPERLGDRPRPGAAPRERDAALVLEEPRARRGGAGVPREAPAALPLRSAPAQHAEHAREVVGPHPPVRPPPGRHPARIGRQRPQGGRAA